MKFVLSDENLSSSCKILKTDSKIRLLPLDQIKDLLITDDNMSLILQQAIFQVLQPICDAKFNKHGYGFLYDRTYENAVADLSSIINHCKLYNIIKLKIVDLYQKLNHNKLMRQLWAFGIHDKKLLQIIRSIFTNSSIHLNYDFINLIYNIMLNELDMRIENMWNNHPLVYKYYIGHNKNGTEIKSSDYNAMRSHTLLKEVKFVRYKDEILIMCRSFEDSKIIQESITKWITKRLMLLCESSLVDIRKKYVDFGYLQFKAIHKGTNTNRKKRYVVVSKIGKMYLEELICNLHDRIKAIQHSKNIEDQAHKVFEYNKFVLKIHKQVEIATLVSKDMRRVSQVVSILFSNRLGNGRKGLRRSNVSKAQSKNMKIPSRYANSKQLRFFKPTGQPIFPIGYVQFRIPHQKKVVPIETR